METEERDVSLSDVASPILSELGEWVERAQSITPEVNALTERVFAFDALDDKSDALSDALGEDASADVASAITTLRDVVSRVGVDWAEGTRKFDALAALLKSFPDMVTEDDASVGAALLYAWVAVRPQETATRKSGTRGPRGTSTTHDPLEEVWADGHKRAEYVCPDCGEVLYSTKDYLNSARDQIINHALDHDASKDWHKRANAQAHASITNALHKIGFTDGGTRGSDTSAEDTLGWKYRRAA